MIWTVTASVLYVLTYARCGENYIGETKAKVRERMNLHRQNIRDSTVLHMVKRVAEISIHNQTIKSTWYLQFYFIYMLYITEVIMLTINSRVLDTM